MTDGFNISYEEGCVTAKLEIRSTAIDETTNLQIMEFIASCKKIFRHEEAAQPKQQEMTFKNVDDAWYKITCEPSNITKPRRKK